MNYAGLAEQVCDFVIDELDLKPGRAAAVLAIALGTTMANGEVENAGAKRILEGFEATMKVIADAYKAEAIRLATVAAQNSDEVEG